MIRHTSKIITLAAIIGIVMGFTGCSFRKSESSPKIVEQPQSQIAKGDEKVSFSVVVSKAREISYQWQFNGSNIPEATKSTYTIPHRVGFSDVGEYQVVVRADGITISKPAYLSIYSIAGTRANSGTLSTPIGQFGNPGLPYPCGNPAFNKGYTPITNGQPMFFYGPNATSQSGIFRNLGHYPTLTIDTFSSDNGTADTGIRIRENWGQLSNACCNDDAPATPEGGMNPGQTDRKQSRCQIDLSQYAGDFTHSNTYRLTVLYKDPPGPPASRKVTFNWNYQ